VWKEGGEGEWRRGRGLGGRGVFRVGVFFFGFEVLCVVGDIVEGFCCVVGVRDCKDGWWLCWFFRELVVMCFFLLFFGFFGGGRVGGGGGGLCFLGCLGGCFGGFVLYAGGNWW